MKKEKPSLNSKLDEQLRDISFEDSDSAKSKIEELFESWESNKKLTKELDLRFGYRKDNIQVETQFGNIARYYTDIIKLEKAFQDDLIDIGVLIVPDRDRSKSIGTNVAYYERAEKELKEMREIISCPIVVYGL